MFFVASQYFLQVARTLKEGNKIAFKRDVEFRFADLKLTHELLLSKSKGDNTIENVEVVPLPIPQRTENPVELPTVNVQLV
jgi:hypothetical protein